MSVVNYPTPDIQISQNRWEFEKCLSLFVDEAPIRILEIGTYLGGTAWAWMKNSEHTLAHFVCVDWFTPDADGRELVKKTAEEVCARLTIIQGDTRSPETVEQARLYAPYDWCFIDAGHGINEVTSDWNNYGPMVREGGVVAFHDLNQPGSDVGILWRQIKQQWRTVEISQGPTAASIGLLWKIPAKGNDPGF